MLAGLAFLLQQIVSSAFLNTSSQLRTVWHLFFEKC